MRGAFLSPRYTSTSWSDIEQTNVTSLNEKAVCKKTMNIFVSFVCLKLKYKSDTASLCVCVSYKYSCRLDLRSSQYSSFSPCSALRSTCFVSLVDQIRSFSLALWCTTKHDWRTSCFHYKLPDGLPVQISAGPSVYKMEV